MRYIGIRHRVKKTAKGEARPTQVAISAEGKTVNLNLDDETAELDFVRGTLPTAWKKVTTAKDLKDVAEHHIQWRKAGDEDISTLSPKLLHREGKQAFIADKVPAAYEGIRESDTVCMALGGSGGYLAIALTRRLEKLGGKMLSIPPILLEQRRQEGRPKDEDAALLAELAQRNPEMFYKSSARGTQITLLRVALRAWQDAMKDRIACQQRLAQLVIGRIFCPPDGLFPEGSVEKAVKSAKTKDPGLKALVRKEAKCLRDLTKILEGLDVYQKLLAPQEGIGPSIAARIIGETVDIRQFPSADKYISYVCLHLLEGGIFPRHRNAQEDNLFDTAKRTPFFHLADQWNRRPKTEWGQKLIENKRRRRTYYPHPVLVCKDGQEFPLIAGRFTYEKKTGVYTIQTAAGPVEAKGIQHHTNAHIHKTAIWRTLTQFARWLYKEWWKLEKSTPANSGDTEQDLSAAA